MTYIQNRISIMYSSRVYIHVHKHTVRAYVHVSRKNIQSIYILTSAGIPVF